MNESERTRAGETGTGFDRERVQETVQPVLRRWESGGELFGVRRRLRSVFGAGLVVIAIQFAFSPEGFTGLLLTLWVLLSMPVVVVVGCLLVLLRSPSDAPGVWWENSVPATIGLLSLAGFVRAGESSPVGRALWELVIGDDHPDAETHQFGDDGLDLDAVRRIRRYVYYAVVGSAAIILLDQIARNDLLSGGASVDVSLDLGGPALAAVVAGAVIVGIGVGFVLAAVQR